MKHNEERESERERDSECVCALDFRGQCRLFLDDQNI
jgi:hypothetical protein